MPFYIIVTGLPASGKSTIGKLMAPALEIPFLDKDEILEDLFDRQGIGDVAWRKRLSRAADDILRERARQSTSAVITSWWRHPNSALDSGTPVEWLEALPGIVIELYCHCRPPVAAARFLSRRRHEGHLDRLKSYDELISGFRQHAALGPLGIGRLIEKNTEEAIDLDPLLEEIAFIIRGKT